MVQKDKKDKKVKAQDITHEQIDEKATLLTKEGLDKLDAELLYLKDTKRREVAARIKEAISYGDLSENSEYEESKNEQAFVEGRILELEEKKKNVKIIDEPSSAGKRCVQLGTTVSLKNLAKTKEDDEVYTIVGSTEADPIAGKISNESPVGASLLGCSVGDEIKVKVPAGFAQYKVMKLE